MLRIIMECVSWVTEDFLWEHEWVTETNVLWKENDILEALNYDIDVLCPLHWRLLWFSAPSSLNRKFANNGTKVAQFRETVNMAIEITFNVPFDGVHTPRTCLLRAVSVPVSNAPDRDLDLEKELKEWRLCKLFQFKHVTDCTLTKSLPCCCLLCCLFFFILSFSTDRHSSVVQHSS